MGKKKLKRDSRKSKGMSRASRATRALQRLLMKINRWRQYRQEERAANSKSRVGWNTEGMERHATLLESIIKKGSTKR